MRKGYIQVYTGNGKGKTTAALGLALRAAGAGLKVFIVQFIKKQRCSEHASLARFQDSITLRQFGKGCILKRTAKPSDRKAAHTGREITLEAMLSSEEEYAPGCDKWTMDSPPPLKSDADGKYPIPQPGIVTTREY